MRRTKQTNSRVIHQDANGTECRFGFRNKLRDLAYICDLGKMKKRTRAELFHVCRGIFQGLAVAAANGHGGSERCQAMRDGAADAAAPSGHQRYTSGKLLLFQRSSICIFIPAVRILPRTGHSFCATLILSSVIPAAVDVPVRRGREN